MQITPVREEGGRLREDSDSLVSAISGLLVGALCRRACSVLPYVQQSRHSSVPPAELSAGHETAAQARQLRVNVEDAAGETSTVGAVASRSTRDPW